MASALLKQAISLHRGGKIAAAEQMYRRVLREEPGNSDALHFLGLVAHQSGRHSEAADHIGKAIAIRPTSLYWYNLGHVHLALKDNAAAEAAFCRTVELTSTHSEALFQLGLLRLASDDLDNAKDHFRRAIAAKPDFVEARINLALLLQRIGDSTGALAQLNAAKRVQPDEPKIHNALGIIHTNLGFSQDFEHFRRALALKPDYTEARINLAKALHRVSRHAEAVELLEEVSRQRPGDADVRMLLGAAYTEMNELDAAARHYDAAARAAPSSPKPLVALGHLYLRFGRFDEAFESYQRARSVEPTNCNAAAALLTHLKARLSPDEAEQIGQLLEYPTLSDQQRRQLHFSLAAYLEAAGDYDRAFLHMDEGNRLRRMELEARSGPFDIAAHIARIDSVIKNFDQTYFRRVAGFGVDSKLPVFIVGMPRSGTTLCEQILASHSQVIGAGELNDISLIVSKLREPSEDLTENRDFAAYAQSLDLDTVRKTAFRHLRRLESRAPKAARIVDKMPVNYQHLGLIVTLFPQATVIHCRRDPMDTGLSCYSKDFDATALWACDLKTIGQVYCQYERLMEHWRSTLPIKVLEFQYEHIVASLEHHAHQLIEFCGLDWEAGCLEFYRTERLIRTASVEQVRRPIYHSSVSRWRRFRQHLMPLRRGLAAR